MGRLEISLLVGGTAHLVLQLIEFGPTSCRCASASSNFWILTSTWRTLSSPPLAFLGTTYVTMKIHPSRFRATPRPVRYEADADTLRAFLQDAGAGYDDVGQPAIFEGEAVRHHGGLKIDGTLDFGYALTCGRCTAQRTREAHIPIHWTLMPVEELNKEQLRPHELVELSTDDLDVSFFRDDEVDIAELVREAVLLYLDPNSECGEEDCDARLTELLKTQRDAPSEDPIDPRWAGLADLKSKLKN